MRIIEIAALDNGAHRNQEGTFATIPQGWAVVPGTTETPNFPFGNITVDEATPPVVLTWEPLPMPEPESTTDQETPLTDAELAAAITAGVNEV